jgi:hypothetical protein
VTRVEAAKLIAFMQTRRYPDDPYSFSGELPDPARYPTPNVIMTRDQVVRFRAQMAELHAFACAVTGADPKELNSNHLAAWLWKTAEDEGPPPAQEK